MISTISQDADSNKKRTLAKVRRCFLNKRTDSDEPRILDPDVRYLSIGTTFIIDGVNGIAEVNRKICIGPQFLNVNFTMQDFLFEDHRVSRALTLNINGTRGKDIIPIEYSFKRLESLGDLELATWAHRINKFTRKYPDIFQQFNMLLLSKDQKIQEALEKATAHVARTCKEIESKYPYHKTTFGLFSDGSRPLSFSFSESFLKEMGYTYKSFLSTVEGRGLPAIFDPECSIYIKIVKEFFEEGWVSAQYISESAEYETFVYCQSGKKKKVIVQSITLVSLIAGVPTVYSYFIIKNSCVSPSKANGGLREGMDFHTRVKKQIKSNRALEEIAHDFDIMEDISQRGNDINDAESITRN